MATSLRKFDNGQLVVALTSHWLEPEEAAQLGNPATPKKGLAYTIRSQHMLNGIWYLDFVDETVAALGYDQQYFAPFEILTDDALMEMLEGITESVPML